MYDASPTDRAFSVEDSDVLVRDEAHAGACIVSACFTPGPVGRIGIELEWLVRDIADPAAPVSVARGEAALDGVAVLPNGTRLTSEPGGQLELSSTTYESVSDAVAGVAADLRATRGMLAEAGLELIGDGLDPVRPPQRFMSLPRYDTMERYFDRWGVADSRHMMCSTASVQLNFDAGRDLHEIRTRWRHIQALSPVLVAAFANSPFWLGRPTGWRSTRQAIWARLDPARTGWPAADDPVEAYVNFALDAPMMCIRSDDASWDAPPGLSFRQWVSGDASVQPVRPPTVGDLMYHLTTLFPPVRPRGWFELRFIDAQPDDDWQVVAAVVATLIDDAAAADAARLVTTPLTARPDIWTVAAREGLNDPQIAAAAAACFGIALDTMRRTRLDDALIGRVADWAARHIDSCRSPADRRLAQWRRTGSTITSAADG